MSTLPREPVVMSDMTSRPKPLLCLLASLLLQTPLTAQTDVRFNNFRYTGVSQPAPKAGSIHNPILPGMYPDPSIVRDGADFYLVNSTFAWFPGVPVFHSRDLAEWEQIGFVLDRPSQLNTSGMQVSRGVFAPSLRVHEGTFYLITTDVDGIGNFYVTAKNPAGPWSEPVRLPEINGIDPSLFFDDDGKAYIVHNGPPPDGKSLYDGHRAIWLFPFDLTTGKVYGSGRILVDGGVDISQHPAWIEGPHLFRHGGFYYLIAAEGGTSERHSEVVFRATSLNGPFVPYEHNPILTQRNLPTGRLEPIADTGHADFTDDGHGNWWAVFLGVEPYEANDFNTGRETFLLPVTWKDDWPVILAQGEAVPRNVERPQWAAPFHGAPARRQFVWTDTFRGPALKMQWQFLRTPREKWYSFSKPSGLLLRPRADTLTGRGNPSFLGHRQQHANFTASVRVGPVDAGAEAGLALFQNEHAYSFLAVVGASSASRSVVLFQGKGTEAMPGESEAGRSRLPKGSGTIELKIVGTGGVASFWYRTGGGGWKVLASNVDATGLSTTKAGGFVGTFIGPYARPTASPSATP